MESNQLKKMLGAGEAAIGTWVFMGPDVVEIAAMAGLDFVIIDAEHSSTSLVEIEECVRAADASQVSALVRVGSDNSNTILRVLEMGAHGVVVPKIESGEQARRVVAAVRYPPGGTRGSFGYTRAARYGSIPLAEHAASSNRELLVVGMIETAAGVAEAGAIVTSGLDGIFIGKSDLATALGVPGRGDDPAVAVAVDTILAAARATDIWVMVGVGGPGDVELWRSAGCHAFTFAHEYAILAQAYRDALPAMRAAAAQVGDRADGNR